MTNLDTRDIKSKPPLDETFFRESMAEDSLKKFCRSKYLRRENPFQATDEASYLNFVFKAPQIVPKMLEKVRRGQYQFSPARPVLAQLDKERTIYQFSWAEQFIIFHLANSLMFSIESTLPASVHSYRHGRSAHTALQRWASWVQSKTSQPIYIFRGDIKNFGESISHPHFLKALSRHFTLSEPLFRFMESILKHPIQEGDHIIFRSKGLPTGHYLQLVAENILLCGADLDLEASSENALYLRYGDDVLIAANTAEQRDQLRDRWLAHLVELDLQAHEDKSFSFALRPPHQLSQASLDRSHFRYLGRHLFWNGDIRWPKDKLQKLRAKFEVNLRQAFFLGSKTPSSIRHQSVTDFLNRFIQGPFSQDLAELRGEDPKSFKAFKEWARMKYYQAQFGKSFNRALFRRAKNNHQEWSWPRQAIE